MESTTVHAAAQITGWSVRMLHYLDAAGLVSPPRSSGGYRLYGEQEIAHLRELRQLLADHDLKPADLQVALRLRSEPALRRAVDGWLDATSDAASATTAQAVAGTGKSHAHSSQGRSYNPVDRASSPPPPASDPSTSWLRFEQDKHSRALQSRNAHEKEHA